MANPVSAQQALARLQNFCSRGEKCIADIRAKLKLWQINEEDSNKIIKILQADKYIDENRYASAFVRDKSRFSHWGAIKIRTALKTKNIPDSIINNILKELDAANYENDLKAILKNKVKSVKAKNSIDLKAKLIRFGLSRGFEYDLVYREVSRIVKNTDDE